MRIKVILSALKQEFLENSFMIAVCSLVIVLIAGMIYSPLVSFSVFAVLFILIMAVYLVFSVGLKIPKVKKEIATKEQAEKTVEEGKEITTIEQAEDAQERLIILGEDKTRFLKKKESFLEMLSESRDELKELEKKKEKFGHLPLNVAGIEGEIESKKWAIDYYPKEIKTLDAKVGEIDVEAARINKELEAFLTRR